MKEKSKRELEAAELEKKAKTLRREEARFWKEIEERSDKVIEYLIKKGLLEIGQNNDTTSDNSTDFSNSIY